MSITNSQLADVLDSVADFLEKSANASLREKQAARVVRVNDLAERYLDSTGEEMPGELRDKLASLDDDVLDLVIKTANNAGGSPDSLGGPAETADMSKAASDMSPEERFARWVMS